MKPPNSTSWRISTSGGPGDCAVAGGRGASRGRTRVRGSSSSSKKDKKDLSWMAARSSRSRLSVLRGYEAARRGFPPVHPSVQRGGAASRAWNEAAGARPRRSCRRSRSPAWRWAATAWARGSAPAASGRSTPPATSGSAARRGQADPGRRRRARARAQREAARSPGSTTTRSSRCSTRASRTAAATSSPSSSRAARSRSSRPPASSRTATSLRIGLALTDALAHAHERGVIHRDVKPQNVIVPDAASSRRGAAKLTDFGVAHLAGEDALTHTGDVVGTLAYMAPEQAAGRPVDERADLYALGARPLRGAGRRPPGPGRLADRDRAPDRHRAAAARRRRADLPAEPAPRSTARSCPTRAARRARRPVRRARGRAARRVRRRRPDRAAPARAPDAGALPPARRPARGARGRRRARPAPRSPG